MKKFLKVFIIVLLVVAAIAGTCYFFFKNLKEKNNTTSSISEYLYSDSKSEFNLELQSIGSLVNSDGTDSRIDLLIKTNANLDSIVEILASYYVPTDTKINNERIAKSFNEVVASRNLLSSMMSEYKIKKDSEYFNRHIGANDFYKQTCSYFVEYAKFANYLNSNLSLNKSSDIKFSMFEIYCNVVIDTFAKTTVTSSKVVISNSVNINKINGIFKLQNSYIVTKVNPFDKLINTFNNAYYDCNKMEFASNIASNIATVNGSNQPTNEKVATYYFKQIFGV